MTPLNFLHQQLTDFLKNNNCQCRTQFVKEIYDLIDDENDKEFYAWSSCIPYLNYIPPSIHGKLGTLYVRCGNYSPNSGFQCLNLHYKINKILNERLERLNGIEFTFQDISSLLTCEVDCD